MVGPAAHRLEVAGGVPCAVGHVEESSVTRSSTRRVGAIAVATALFVAACSSGATPAPATRAPTTAPDGMAPGDTAPAMTAPEPGSANVTLEGAGATFPAPLYEVWFEKYTGRYGNVQFNYQAIGSGGGIKAITEQTVDFGASDAAMKDDEIAALPAGVKLLHVPTALGAVVVIYNVSGVTDLNLDADTVSGIFLGTITKWNDPAIAALNGSVNLPDEAITVVHRSDGSGTTNAFTTYLDTVSPDWHSQVGAGKEVSWPTGIGAAGNDGVAAGVKQTDGTVGYVELNYATQTGLASAKVKNADGNFVAGSTAGVTAAAEAAAPDFPADFRQAPIINGAGPDTYPIASYTYLLIPIDWTDADKAQDMVAFTYWALNDGQAEEDALGYAPLPAPIQEKSLAELHQVKANGTAIWP
jgi:phosphate transport system substrate-binding protein